MANLKKITLKSPRWCLPRLHEEARRWLQRAKAKKRAVGEGSTWWDFLFYFEKNAPAQLEAFAKGAYPFSPMEAYAFSGEKIILWAYPDRLVLSLLLAIIRPCFPHIFSKTCLHLKGPAGVKTVLGQVQRALDTQSFRYIIRADVKSYYASVDRKILAQQAEQAFNDPRLLHYLKSAIGIAVNDGGNIINANKGIPIRSSLSPFFGALYLSPLDRAFEKREGVFYLRFMDDILVLAKTKRQFLSAKRRLQNMLGLLKLKLSRGKTRMGLVKKGFHFLGIEFCLAQTKQEEFQVAASIHKRSCYRALERVRVTKADAGSPEHVQRYLLRWATWWRRALCQLKLKDIILAWVAFARAAGAALAWLGSGLLLD